MPSENSHAPWLWKRFPQFLEQSVGAWCAPSFMRAMSEWRWSKHNSPYCPWPRGDGREQRLLFTHLSPQRYKTLHEMPATSVQDHPWVLCQVHGRCVLVWCCDSANKSKRLTVVKGLTLCGNLPFWYKPGESSPGAAAEVRRLYITFSPQECLNYGKFVLIKFLFRGMRMKAKETFDNSRIIGKFSLEGTSGDAQFQTPAHSKDSFKGMYSQAGKL